MEVWGYNSEDDFERATRAIRDTEKLMLSENIGQHQPNVRDRTLVSVLVTSRTSTNGLYPAILVDLNPEDFGTYSSLECYAIGLNFETLTTKRYIGIVTGTKQGKAVVWVIAVGEEEGSGGDGDDTLSCVGIVSTITRQLVTCLGGHTVSVTWTETTRYDENCRLQVDITNVESEIPACMDCCPDDDDDGSGGSGDEEGSGGEEECEIPFEILRLLPLKATFNVLCYEDFMFPETFPCVEGLEITLDPVGGGTEDDQYWSGAEFTCPIGDYNFLVMVNVRLMRDPLTGCLAGACFFGTITRHEGGSLVGGSFVFIDTSIGEPCSTPDSCTCVLNILNQSPLELETIEIHWQLPVGTGGPSVVCNGTITISLP